MAYLAYLDLSNIVIKISIVAVISFFVIKSYCEYIFKWCKMNTANLNVSCSSNDIVIGYIFVKGETVCLHLVFRI